MSILSNITTGKRGRAQKGIIAACEGYGKSTLASQFPAPLFFDVEDSTSQMDVARLGRADLPTLAAFESALSEVVKTKPCSTLIVDTIDWLEQMALDQIIADCGNPKIQGIEDFGYGKGYTILKERVTLVLAKFDQVIAAGIHVILLAHTKVVKFEPPDGAGPYDRYELKLSKQVAPLVKEWADMLLFGNWRVQVKERDKNESGAQFKGVGGKERLMHATRTAAWDAKNRHGMADTEKWGIEPIERAFRAVGAPWGEKTLTAKEGGSHVTDTKKPSGGVTPPVAAPAAPSGEDPDQIPGLPVVPAPEVQDSPELAAFVAICQPHAQQINDYLRKGGRIKLAEDFRHVPADYMARVLKNPAGFLKVAGIKAQEVAA